MSFLQQYDRLLLVTLGLVSLIRGLGNLAAIFAAVLDPSGTTASAGGGQSAALGLLALLHASVLCISGLGLLLRRRLGWQLSVAVCANEFGKLAGALIITALLGASAAALQIGTDLLVRMTWALFSLLVFMLQPIARLCRVEGSVVGAAAPWMALGASLALVKLAAVM